MKTEKCKKKKWIMENVKWNANESLSARGFCGDERATEDFVQLLAFIEQIVQTPRQQLALGDEADPDAAFAQYFEGIARFVAVTSRGICAIRPRRVAPFSYRAERCRIQGGNRRQPAVQEHDPMSSSVPLAELIAPPGPGGRDGAIPPLESGDRMTRDEFERRYAAMLPHTRAELIEGVVYVASPVHQKYHCRQHHQLHGWLASHEAGTPGVEGGDNSTVRLELTNEPQPDCVFFIQPEHGGQVQIDTDGYINGAPDLVAEVTASTASCHLHDKLASYQRNGVREYLVCRVLDRQLDWFVLRAGRYERHDPAPDGSLRSTVFAGLWLDPAALLRGDLPTVLALVQQGLASPEHAEFAAALGRLEPIRLGELRGVECSVTTQEEPASAPTTP